MNFEEIIDRKNSNSVKWDFREKFNVPDDVIPFWVADMDFKAPEGVIDAVGKLVSHGIFGYSDKPESYYRAVCDWMMRRHNWKIEKEWIVTAPGVVPAINFIIRSFTEKGDAILIQRPVYYPFSNSINNNNRLLINNSLILNDGKYTIDFKDFEEKIVKNDVKLFIMSSPHNPIGRLWTKEELQKIGDICLKYNVLVVSDEIHHDLVFKGNRHIPFASLGTSYSRNCITCTAPSKTFNIAGLQVSNLIIENEEIRNKLVNEINNLGISSTNCFGIVACEAAYNTGEQWLDELLDYIWENKNYVKQFIEERLPDIRVLDSQATYLLWIDFRGLGIDHEELEKFMLHEAKLWLDEGYIFGDEGKGFERINIACPRKLLEKGLMQLESAIKRRKA